MKIKKLISTTILGVFSISLLVGCGTSSSSGTGAGSKGNELKGLSGTIGSKDFAEQYILAHMTVQLLNAHGASLEANTKLVGSKNVREALTTKKFIGYWEYTGTAWITYLQNTKPITDPAAQFDAVKKADAANGVAWLDPAPFNSTYAFSVRADQATKLKVRSISDIAKLPVSEQTFCIESEFSTRDDGWPGVKKAYGISVPDSNVKLLDTGIIYTATQKGEDCNFGEIFATDGRIKALNLAVMADDKQFFPVYQPSMNLQAQVLQDYPKISEIIAKISPLLTTEKIQELNAQVDVDGKKPEKVSEDFLKSLDLI